MPQVLHPLRQVSESDTSLRVQFGRTVVEHDRAIGTIWVRMGYEDRPSFTHDVLHQLAAVRGYIRGLGPDLRPQFVVLTSQHPTVFNLGGDLELFLETIEAGRWDDLEAYAHLCAETATISKPASARTR